MECMENNLSHTLARREGGRGGGGGGGGAGFKLCLV